MKIIWHSLEIKTIFILVKNRKPETAEREQLADKRLCGREQSERSEIAQSEQRAVVRQKRTVICDEKIPGSRTPTSDRDGIGQRAVRQAQGRIGGTEE